MQSRQDSPAPSKRPSLLATDQEETVHAQPLLAGLDGAAADRPSTASKLPPARRGGAWLAALLVLVAGAGAAVWMSSADNAPERVAAAPAVAPAPAPRALAGVPATEVAEVSTAAILQDTPAADDKPARAGPVTGSDSSLAAALESKPGASTTASSTVPSTATPAAAAAKPVKARDDGKAARAREHRLAVREREEKLRAEKHPLARKVTAKAADKKARAAEADDDSDVALLAALVAHSKNSQAAKPATDANADAARKLRLCKGLDSVAEADACRARLCAGSAKNSPACKPSRAAQVVDAS